MIVLDQLVPQWNVSIKSRDHQNHVIKKIRWICETSLVPRVLDRVLWERGWFKMPSDAICVLADKWACSQAGKHQTHDSEHS